MNCFHDALEVHLKSITEKDFDAFSSFFSQSQNCILILPNGHRLEGYQAILDFHKEWFQDLDWSIGVQIIDTFTMDNTGYALKDVSYFDVDEDGIPYEMNYYLSLLFGKIDDAWILLRDQNTLK